MRTVGAERCTWGAGRGHRREGPVHQHIPVVLEVLWVTGSQKWLLAYQLNQSVIKTGGVLEEDCGVLRSESVLRAKCPFLVQLFPGEHSDTLDT